MPDVSSTIAKQLFWAIILVSLIQIVLSDENPGNSKPLDDKSQNDQDISKRDWNKNLHIWGKRGWNNLHGGWGLKRSDQMYLPLDTEKRSWQSLQGGWGKRYAPEQEEFALKELAALLEQEQTDPQLTEYGFDNDLDVNDDEKRNWGQFHGGWGKRSKWDKFRGSWGKRDPAWSNLRGIWGKRFADK